MLDKHPDAASSIPPTRRPYNDHEYRTLRAWLTANPGARTCWHDGCDNPATTIDHVPAIMHHTHIRGTGCCELRPACERCNKSTGAIAGNMAREPASGWLLGVTR